MQVSTNEQVTKMYDDTSSSYNKMMDAEIKQPVYTQVMTRLFGALTNLAGPVVDTSCGSGHMLAMYHAQFDQNRSLIGVDLSPKMAAIASQRIGAYAKVHICDMRELDVLENNCAAAVISFFALHHLDTLGAQAAFVEWHRVLANGGQLVVAAWEGEGTIDYGKSADIVALYYGLGELVDMVKKAGFSITRSVVEAVDDMPMDAIHIEATKV